MLDFDEIRRIVCLKQKRVVIKQKQSERILIKIGSKFFKEKGWIRRLWRLTGEVSKCQKQGYKNIIVSSGSVTFGKKILPTAPKVIQAMIGQPILMFVYSLCFYFRKVITAQCLYTKNELENDNEHYTADSLAKALKSSVVPIINANDGVDHQELDALGKCRDNDILAKVIATVMKVNRVIIVTDLLEAISQGVDIIPKVNVANAEQLKLIKEMVKVNHIDDGGTGGSVSKITVAQNLALNDILVNIIDIRLKKGFLGYILKGGNPGQFFYSL